VSRCLQLDVGNSSAKWRLVEDGRVIARGKYAPQDQLSEQALLGCSETLDQLWVSSVASAEAEATLQKLLLERWGLAPWFARTSVQAGELVNSYSDPSRMGVDRWLAMLGARGRTRDRVCVVDAGSALTIDIVAASGRHEGGYIIPGPALMEQALLLDTDRVRFAEEVEYALSPGRSTAEAVRHGIALAQAGAVAMALDAAGPERPALLFCGGAGEILMDLLGNGGEWLPDLVFEGLELLAAERSLPRSTLE
jgi:type III pantothenate kinase